MPIESLDDLVQVFDELIGQIPQIVLDGTEVGALDALALVDERNTQTGIDANGTAYVDYTPSYKKRKEKLGWYRGHVDFVLTGQMMASTTTGLENIVATEKTIAGTTAKVVFDGRDENTRKKIEGNNRKRPGFLTPSKSEVETASETATEYVEERIAEFFK